MRLNNLNNVRREWNKPFNQIRRKINKDINQEINNHSTQKELCCTQN